MAIGHNGGPPLDEAEEPPGKLLFLSYAWRKARSAAFKAPTHEIALFRLARAEAAGKTYEAYVAELLDSGRYDQTPQKSKPKPSPVMNPHLIKKPNTPAATPQPLLQSQRQSPHVAQVEPAKGGAGHVTGRTRHDRGRIR